MNRLVEWIQAAGAVGVLIGIVLVLVQLQQNETCELLNNPVGKQWLTFHEGRPDGEMLEELNKRIDECRPTFLQSVRDKTG